MENKFKLLQNQYDILKEKYKLLQEEYSLSKTHLSNEVLTSKDNASLLESKIKDLELKNYNLEKDNEILIKSKCSLLSEVFTFNKYILELVLEKEGVEFENKFLKSELVNLKNIINHREAQLKKVDNNYSNINLIMKEYQSTLIDMEVTNFYFQVSRIGTVLDTKADVRQ